MRHDLIAAVASIALAFTENGLLTRDSLADEVATQNSDLNAEHLRVLHARAEKIVAPLRLENPQQAQRVVAVIAEQYRRLGEVHDAAGKAGVDQAEIDALHRRFVARLAAELNHEQVDRVKDGITYGVVPITLEAYQQLLPQLTDEQRREIRAQLLEAREYAMDAGSSEAKHATFGKYKGRINNYLSKAGYDMKQAERDLASRRKVASQASASQVPAESTTPSQSTP